MDEDIIILVNKIFVNISKTPMGNRNGLSLIDREQLVSLVLSYRNKFNPDKGKFETFFSTITKNCIVRLYKRDEKRIMLIMDRQSKIRKLLT